MSQKLDIELQSLVFVTLGLLCCLLAIPLLLTFEVGYLTSSTGLLEACTFHLFTEVHS